MDEWVWRAGEDVTAGRKPKYSEKACPSPNLATLNSLYSDLTENPGLRGVWDLEE